MCIHVNKQKQKSTLHSTIVAKLLVIELASRITTEPWNTVWNHLCRKWNAAVNHNKYIHTLMVSEPNIFCGGREGESEECWKREEQKEREEQAYEASWQDRGKWRKAKQRFEQPTLLYGITIDKESCKTLSIVAQSSSVCCLSCAGKHNWKNWNQERG